jgi:hypothetical protein
VRGLPKFSALNYKEAAYLGSLWELIQRLRISIYTCFIGLIGPILFALARLDSPDGTAIMAEGICHGPTILEAKPATPERL